MIVEEGEGFAVARYKYSMNRDGFGDPWTWNVSVIGGQLIAVGCNFTRLCAMREIRREIKRFERGQEPSYARVKGHIEGRL